MNSNRYLIGRLYHVRTLESCIYARPTERETKTCESKNIQNAENMKKELYPITVKERYQKEATTR